MPSVVSTAQDIPALVDLSIKQGTDFSHVLALQNSDGTIFTLTGYTARMQIREFHYSTTFLVELTTANGRISINAAAGQITLSLTNTDTSAFTWRSGVYDLEIVSSTNVVKCPMAGMVTVTPEVTR